ncbi:MAG: Flp pilus assembly complex ATPase component TadA [Deltaproteobacteria bacterium]|nr:Flp pilus assembly complex ATPase component TadA [Deltaproteobacteria bacterium]MBW1946697.1 Flp pilus assembly complex ATPase component TadA [Deltaproteobacteria bacterium]MBW2098405.1 Flp pilus assembly complex ATPase component TadA [Deltaproteobacteria bacterium]
MSHPYHDPDYIFPILEREGLLSKEQVAELTHKLSIRKRKGRDLVQWLDSLKLPRADSPDVNLMEADIISLIARDHKWTFRRLDPLRLDMEIVTKTLPASFARKRLVLPVSWEDGELEIVCYDPEDQELQQDLERACQARTRISVAPRRDIERIISEFFDFKQSIAAAENVLKLPAVDISNLEQFVRLAAPNIAASDKYIQKAVDHLFQYALDQRASDIHIEPKRALSWIRIRIDGILHTIYRLPRVVHEPICTKIKTMSRLDIAEKRRPQDGRLKVAWKNKEAEVRVSTIPVAFGEKVVLRLQSEDILFSDLNKLGFSERDLRAYERFIQNSHGIILITGPTGSGKSTTLYSTLRHLSSPDINIITVEDPIEMVYEEFNQIAVQPQIDVTFASILRNILRQDPDIVMIGEIRDGETARYAIQAALTGHLVFSTLHTNDAVSAITRLKDLGLDSYLIASTLIGIVAQRLVRMVCRSCGKPVIIPADRLRAFGCRVSGHTAVNKGTGCNRCRNTGYWGRIGIYEVFSVSDTIREMIHSEENEETIKKQAFKEGMRTLKHDACRKLLSGITSMEEVIGVTS